MAVFALALLSLNLSGVATHLGLDQLLVKWGLPVFDVLGTFWFQLPAAFLVGMWCGSYLDHVLKKMGDRRAWRAFKGHALVDAMHEFADNGEAERRRELESKGQDRLPHEVRELAQLEKALRRRFRTLLIDGDLIATGLVEDKGERVEIAASEIPDLKIRISERAFVKSGDAAKADLYTQIRIKRPLGHGTSSTVPTITPRGR